MPEPRGSKHISSSKVREIESCLRQLLQVEKDIHQGQGQYTGPARLGSDAVRAFRQKEVARMDELHERRGALRSAITAALPSIRLAGAAVDSAATPLTKFVEERWYLSLFEAAKDYVNALGDKLEYEELNATPPAAARKGGVVDLPSMLDAVGVAELLRRRFPDVTDAQVETFLRRHRSSHPDSFTENENPRRGEARFLYRTSEVMPVLEARFSRPED